VFCCGCFADAWCACDEYDVFHECILGVWISYWLRMWLGLLKKQIGYFLLFGVFWCWCGGGV